MKGYYWWMSLLGVLLLTFSAYSRPATPQSQQALRGMNLVPQWHCLRYRKFDFIRRCRNYRAGRRY